MTRPSPPSPPFTPSLTPASAPTAVAVLVVRGKSRCIEAEADDEGSEGVRNSEEEEVDERCSDASDDDEDEEEVVSIESMDVAECWRAIPPTLTEPVAAVEAVAESAVTATAELSNSSRVATLLELLVLPALGGRLQVELEDSPDLLNCITLEPATEEAAVTEPE
jgi:hypothetical protein